MSNLRICPCCLQDNKRYEQRIAELEAENVKLKAEIAASAEKISEMKRYEILRNN